MSEDFNPYHVWLSIRPEEQPPNHYRLLGLPLFETNADVIDSAADRQMAHLRTFQSGKHGDLTQRLLNEVAAARICLLDVKKRAVYDQQLRAKLPAAAPVAVAVPPAIQLAKAPVPPQRALATPAADNWDDLLGNPAARQAQKAGGRSANPLGAPSAKQAANSRLVSIGIALGVVVLAGIGFGVYASLSGKSEGTLVFDWPDRTDVAVTVDGATIEVPAAGAWEQNFAPGQHHVVAQRPAYKLSADVNLAAGQRVNVPPDWQAKATLVLNWPVADRAGAVLKVDGRTQTVSQHDPLELPVEPGQHRIEIARPGIALFNQLVNIAADERPTVVITRPPKEATLVLDWPVEQRGSAELTIDGRAVEASNADPFELTLQAGQHAVRIERPGFEAFATNVELSEGTNDPLKPIWTPVPKTTTAPTVADAPVPVVPVETTTQPVKKLPVPGAADQEKIAKQLSDLYKTSQPGPKGPAKAQELYDVAAKDGSSPAERYMLLMKGAEIAAAAGDLNLSLQGIDTLDADYEIDALEAKQKLLDKFIAAGKPDQVAIAIPTAEQLVDQAVAADRFDIAVVLATSASRAVAKSKIATHKEVEERLSRRRHDIHLLEPIHTAAKKAQETLEKTPADPEANLSVARWLCFYKGDWTAGLPLLAKGNDEKLKALAEQEIKTPADADQQVKLADAWWDSAQKEAGIARDSIHLHAGNIYQEALPNLASVLTKAAIEKRLAEIADLKPIIGTITANNSSGVTQASDGLKFPLNKWVDVLRLVDTTKDAVAGSWSRNGKEIEVDPGREARIVLPVAVEGSYDLEVEFNRIRGNGEVRIYIPVGSHECNLEWGYTGAVSCLDQVDGNGPNQDSNPTKVTSHDIENGHAYRALVKVRVLSADLASIDVMINGKPFLPHWEGRPSVLTVYDFWRMPTLDHLGLGVWQSDVKFSSARLRKVSGNAPRDVSVAESAAPQLVPATTISKKPTGAVAIPLNQWVDVLRLVDPARNTVDGKWSRAGNAISVEPKWGSRIAIPVAIDGSYDLAIKFASNKTEVTIPVGSHGVSLMLGGGDGTVCGFDTVDGRRPFEPGNPTFAHSPEIASGQECLLLVKVRLLNAEQASIDVLLNGKPLLPHWQGNESALAVFAAWTMPKLDHLGLGAWDTRATFSSVSLRMISGHASVDASVADSAPPIATSNDPGGTVKIPIGKWVDVLPFADTTRDAARGTWTRSGAEISCESSQLPLLEIPVVIDGAYDLEVDFTRADGNDSIDTIIPIGTRGCSVKLSGWGGKVSGLGLVDGRQPVDADYSGPVWPGTLENGRRYRLLIRAGLPEPNRASIEVSLDGKVLQPTWTGNQSSLMPGFKLSNPKYLGLAANWSHTTYHAVRLKMNSGQASTKASPKAPSAGAEKPGQLQFTKWAYDADEKGRPGYFQKVPAGWIEMKAGNVAAHFVEAARTADYVELFDRGRDLWVRMTPTEAFWSRDKVKWNSLAKGTPVEEPDAQRSSQDSTQDSSAAPAPDSK